MAQRLEGKAVADALAEQLKKDIGALKTKGVTPTLGIIRVGAKGPDLSYEKGATKRCEEVGAAVKVYELAEDVTQDKLIATIKSANDDKGVHGILLFRPLPKHIDDNAACGAILPAKDMDGITDGSQAGIYSDSGKGFPPCTADSVMHILDHYKIDPSGKKVVVLGRSTVIGKPVSMLLLKRNGTVTICHSKTANLPATVKEADIVVVAMGRALSVGKDSFKAGQYVIDVGVNPNPVPKPAVEDKSWKSTVGDVKFDEVEPIVAGLSPVPGGVGSVTNAILVAHVVEAAKRANA